MSNFTKAFSVFVGTIIGAGIFGLPFVALKSGFFIICLYFLFMAVIVALAHSLLGEVVLGTKKIHRLPGYVGEYLGPRWKKFALFIICFGLIGTLLAYLIIGGEFLNLFFSPYFGGNPTLYTLLFFGLGTLLIFQGIKSISQIEFTFLLLFFVIIYLFFAKTFHSINLNYLKNIDLNFLTYPYGVVLFSLWGSALVPEVKEILGKDKAKLRKVIFLGITAAVIIYLFFVFIILGICGPNTSHEAIYGLAQTAGDGIVKLGFIFGATTCFTSFIALGLTLKKVFWYDLGLSKNLSWFIACFLPLFLFLAGLREFIDVIGITGAIAVGIEGIIIIFLYKEFLKKKFSLKMNSLFYVLPIIFIFGIIFEILYFTTK